MTDRMILICNGKSLSLRDMILHIFKYLGINNDRIKIDASLFRPSEIQDICGDTTKAKELLGWEYAMDFREAIELILEEYRNNFYHV